MAGVAFFLMMVAAARGVHSYIENPTGSTLFSYMMRHLGSSEFPLGPLQFSSVADRCHYSEERMGERYLKPYKFIATGPWIESVNGRCFCKPNLHVELMRKDDKGRVSGTPALKASQAYPDKLGQALVRAWASCNPGIPVFMAPARRTARASADQAQSSGVPASRAANAATSSNSSSSAAHLPDSKRARMCPGASQQDDVALDSSPWQLPDISEGHSDSSSGPWGSDSSDSSSEGPWPCDSD